VWATGEDGTGGNGRDGGVERKDKEEQEKEAAGAQGRRAHSAEQTQLFWETDADGSGFVEYGEFEALAIRRGVSAERARAMFLAHDANGDGKLSLDEFAQLSPLLISGGRAPGEGVAGIGGGAEGEGESKCAREGRRVRGRHTETDASTPKNSRVSFEDEEPASGAAVEAPAEEAAARRTRRAAHGDSYGGGGNSAAAVGHAPRAEVEEEPPHSDEPAPATSDLSRPGDLSACSTWPQKVVAAHPYEALNADELSFGKDERMIVTGPARDPEWYHAVRADGASGVGGISRCGWG